MHLEKKICSKEELLAQLASIPRPLVMTNGVFDVLHRGHVSYLQQAAELGATLLVAVNSDRSSRMLGKGPNRPLNSADDRVYVLAGLAAIDFLTIFDERTPVELIKAIRPDIYVKGGDYDMETLEETQIVSSWGGNSLAIPFVNGFSTTTLVNRIRQTHLPLRKAAFLDRDGVINKDKAHVYRWEDFEFFPGAIEGMLKLQNAGYALIIVTNQSGLARGYYTEEEYQNLCESLRKFLAERGVNIDGIFHCPHHPSGSVQALALICDCRKPAPGLLIKASDQLGIDLLNSILIGDKQSDIDAARAAGVGRAYIINSDNFEMSIKEQGIVGRYSSLLNCVNNILSESSCNAKVINL
jgi:rfaE bifunctional protein nucleotidyltransferase chain/domain